ncbi:hypothetical protein JOC25_000034 [Solibacillus kalamii]|uniref:Cytoplasmic protein n=1 Tax=Solibacillus kalamii TaxID=1748298 RepID=A0ABX3ZHI8_9BACL|nr:DUF6434 domain-containing protein [Solibacillus kalamii]MBM7663578.1 hypothetical protein [Solibacillus kalamii]OUZ39160.1 cytoplasmic protein [Solibacillus kalamii]
MRPELKRELDIQDFRSFYWLKEELQTFCRENGLSASGSKIDITDRIAEFLQTGEIQKPLKKRKSPTNEAILTDLNLDTVITENHRCSQTVRVFFKLEIPKFHFSTYIQNYFRENVGKTYRDVVNAWYEEQERKKDPSYKKQIGSQFEYNQFIRDYFADPKNKGNHREDAIKAWYVIKKLPGSNKYKG